MACVKAKCGRFSCSAGRNQAAKSEPGLMLRYLSSSSILIRSRIPSGEAGSAMSSPFLGEVRPWALNFAPRGWAMCQGQVLSISQNTALFSLLGTTYGGNGTTNFALPDLRGRVPLKYGTDPSGNNYVIGEQGGEESVAITLSTLPAHNHAFLGTTLPADIKRPVTGSAYAQSTEAPSV